MSLLPLTGFMGFGYKYKEESLLRSDELLQRYIREVDLNSK